MAAQQSKQGRLPLPRWKWVHMRPSLPADDLEDLHFNHLLCFQCLNSHDLFRDTVQSILPVLLVVKIQGIQNDWEAQQYNQGASLDVGVWPSRVEKAQVLAQALSRGLCLVSCKGLP